MFRIRPRILTRRIRPLGRLGLEMVEEGVTDLDDILRERLASLKLERDRARSALDRIRARHARKPHDGGYSLPQGWMRSIIERIEVDDGVIRIIGNTSAQEQALDGKPEASGGVRRSVLKWHARAEKPNARTRQWYCNLMSGNSFASDGQEPLPGLARAGVAHSGISWSCNTTMETNEWTSVRIRRLRRSWNS